MTIVLRVLLLGMCVVTFWYVIRKIRKAQMQIEDAIFWILFTLLLLLLSLLPGIATRFSALIGFESPANFIFLSIIFLLLIKQFSMSVHISVMDNKIKELVQAIALKEYSANPPMARLTEGAMGRKQEADGVENAKG